MLVGLANAFEGFLDGAFLGCLLAVEILAGLALEGGLGRGNGRIWAEEPAGKCDEQEETDHA